MGTLKKYWHRRSYSYIERKAVADFIYYALKGGGINKATFKRLAFSLSFPFLPEVYSDIKELTE